ncbi:MAG: hypothetical protein EAX96_18850 [Candidatus Lokiarchaeota archaeon]|nr:hypothetical protein [Candidatus Lokiarchaeota archaeon]
MGLKNKIISALINLGMKFMSDNSLKSVMFLGCSPKKVASHVIMPVTDFIKKRILMHFGDEKPKQHGEVYTGKYNYKEISIISSGIGCPATSLKLEALRDMQIKAIVRFDLCGSLTNDVEIGDIVIANRAICGDGTSPHYWNFEKEKIIDCNEELFKKFTKILDENEVKYHVGPVWTTDALFKETPELIQRALNKSGIAIDMETSIIYTYGKLYEIPSISIMIVSDQPFKNEEGFAIPNLNSKIIDNIQKIAKLILEGFSQI